MHKITISILLTTVVAIGSHAEAQTTPNHANMAMSAPSAITTTVLSGPLGSRSASGSATVTGQVVQLSWNGDTPGAVRAWSVRHGTCSAVGAMIGTTASYAPISVDAKGNGAAAVTLGAPLNMSEAFHIAVHAASEPNSERLACGSLSSGPDVASITSANNMAGMDHSIMIGMDHSNMPGMNPNKPAMDSTMAGMNHAGMNHALMNATSTPLTPMSDSASAILLAIHQRMLADPVIRERVATDPTLQRMMEQLSDMEMSSSGMNTSTAREMSSESAVGVKRNTGVPAKKSTPTSPAKAATKAPVKEPVKAATPSMPAMDHSKMPGMKKPPE